MIVNFAIRLADQCCQTCPTDGLCPIDGLSKIDFFSESDESPTCPDVTTRPSTAMRRTSLLHLPTLALFQHPAESLESKLPTFHNPQMHLQSVLLRDRHLPSFDLVRNPCASGEQEKESDSLAD